MGNKKELFRKIFEGLSKLNIKFNSKDKNTDIEISLRDSKSKGKLKIKKIKGEIPDISIELGENSDEKGKR